MKKVLSLLLSLLLCLCLCACGENETPNTESTQETGRIETDHPAFSYLFGTWKLQDEENAERNPYTEITFNADGTCIMDGVAYRWVIFEEKDAMLLINILSGNDKIAGAALSCSADGLFTYFNAMEKEDYNFCPGVWKNTTSVAPVDFADILYNMGAFWGYTNRSYMTAFCKDSTTLSPDGTWVLDGNIVSCTWNNGGTAKYEIKELNGVYYLVGNRDTMYSDSQVRFDEIPKKSVEITIDNWREYFEFGSDSREVLDQFGEPTGETRTSHFLRLKDEYYRHLIESSSEVLLRFTINGNVRDSRMNGTYWDAQIEEWYFGIDAVEVGENDVFEMVKIQGTLCFVDGLL